MTIQADYGQRYLEPCEDRLHRKCFQTKSGFYTTHNVDIGNNIYFFFVVIDLYPFLIRICTALKCMNSLIILYFNMYCIHILCQSYNRF